MLSRRARASALLAASSLVLVALVPVPSPALHDRFARDTLDGPPIPESSGLRWMRDPGLWMAGGAMPSERDIEVSGDPGRLRFHTHGAIRSSRPVALRCCRVRLTLEADPVLGDDESLGWVSIGLAAANGESTWVTHPSHLMGALVRSNGASQLFVRGAEHTPSAVGRAGPSADGRRRLTLTLEGREEARGMRYRLHGRLDARSFRTEVRGPVGWPERAVVFVGAHRHPGDATPSEVYGVTVSSP